MTSKISLPSSTGPGQTPIVADTEKRFTFRKRTQSPATIWDGEQNVSVRCKLIDMSPTGAKLVLDPKDPAYQRLQRFMPKQFWIKLLYDGAQVCCEVKWQDEDRFGVRFISNFQFADA